MRDAGLEDSSVMAFHMKKLGPLVRRNERGYYELTGLGWKAYKVLRELELESLEDRAEEVLEEISGRKRTSGEAGEHESRPRPITASERVGGEEALSAIGSIINEVVKTVSEVIKSVTPTDIFREVLSKGRVWVDKSAPPAPNVRIEALGSDITLTRAGNGGVRVRGTAHHESDATVKASGGEVRVRVRGVDGEVSIPDVSTLEVIVKGSDLTAKDLKLPPSVSISVLGGDVNLNAVMEELSNLSASIRGGDVLANILVERVGRNASVNVEMFGGDAHIVLRVPRNTRVVRGNVRIVGGDVRIEVDESLTNASGDSGTIVINARVVGGDASVSILPHE